MTIELQKRQISINTKLQDDNTQNIIEGDIIVPDTKPDVISIIHTEGKVKINSKEIHKDMIVIRGTVDFNILYQSDDPSRFICNINHNINFDQTIDIQTSESNVKSLVEYKVEHTDCSILNGRKINVKAILDCYTNVSKEYEVSAISNITDENVELLSKTINVSKNIEGESINSFVNWESDVPIGKPAIKEILRTDASLIDKDIKVTGGKAVIRGNVEVKSLYIPDMNESLVDFVTSEIPFSEVIDIAGADGDNEVNINVKIDDVVSYVKADSDGDLRVVNYELALGFYPFYTQRDNYDIIEDAYSLSSKLVIEKSEVNIACVLEKSKTQSSIKDVVRLSEEYSVLDKVYNVSGKVNLSQINVEKDRVVLDGTVDANITYITKNQENPIKTSKHQIPFHNTIEIKGLENYMEVDVKPQIEKFSFDIINDRELELRNILTLCVQATTHQNYQFISKIDELQLDDSFKKSQPSMIVYYVQHGDTLWSIAKKYYTTVMQLQKVNDIENPELLVAGKQLLIPKMV